MFESGTSDCLGKALKVSFLPGAHCLPVYCPCWSMGSQSTAPAGAQAASLLSLLEHRHMEEVVRVGQVAGQPLEGGAGARLDALYKQ